MSQQYQFLDHINNFLNKEFEEKADQTDKYRDLLKLYLSNKRLRDFQQFAFKSYEDYVKDLFDIINDPINNIIMMKSEPTSQKIDQLRIKFIGLAVQAYPQQDEVAITPHQCTLYSKTYQTAFVFDDIELQYVQIAKENLSKIDVKIFTNLIDKQKQKDKKFFHIPVMVGSKYCTSNYFKDTISEDNPCQQFIINGKQKVIVPFERLNTNEVVSYIQKGEYCCSISSKSFVDKFTNINNMQLFIKTLDKKSKQFDQYFDICVRLQQLKRENVAQKNMSVFMLFYALNVVNDKQILELCSFGDQNVFNYVSQALINFKTYYLKIISQQYNSDSTGDNQNQTLKQEQLHQFALNFLEKQKLDKLGQKNIRQILQENILSHVFYNQDSICDTQQRAEFLGFMVYHLIATYLGQQEPANRDTYMYKRCVSVGQLLFQLTEDIYKRHLKDIRKKFESLDIREDVIRNNVQLIFNFLFSNSITNDINKQIATGEWNKKTKGVSQTYKIGSIFSMYQQNRKISNNPTSGQVTKKTEQRDVDPYTIGYIANEESVEGENIGAVFSFALTCDLTSNYQNFIPSLCQILENYAENYQLYDYSPTNSNYTKIFIQGLLKYVVYQPYNFIKKFRELRLKQEIPYEISYYCNEKLNYILLFTDAGRYIRPVIVINENGEPLVTDNDIEDIRNGKYIDFNDFTSKNPGKIHYLELRESQNVLIAENFNFIQKQNEIRDLQIKQDDLMEINTKKVRIANNPNKSSNIASVKNKSLQIPQNIFDYAYCTYDYMDIHPAQMNGALSSSVYFFSHNPGQRNIFVMAQKKSVVQQQIHDNQYVFHKKIYYLVNGDRQLIRTLSSDYLKTSKYACGQLINVMLSQVGGFDQEDSVVFRQSSAKQIYLQTFEDIYEAEFQKISTRSDYKFMKIQTKRNPKYNYNKINEEGMIAPGTIVHKGDVIIGKVQIIVDSTQVQQQYDDQSVVYDQQEGIVLQSIITTGKEAVQKITVKIRTFVYPQVGDKMAVFSGGCKATISKILEDDRFPSYDDGTQPDMIMNIHSLYTRRSMGILFEGLTTQLAVRDLKIIENSPFQTGIGLFTETVQKLQQSGINGLHLKQRIDPYLLEPVGEVFAATLYFHALSQKPKDKIQSIDYQQGTKTLLYRHYVAGKKKRGGIKYMGDLEKSAILAQNASFVTNEMMSQHCDGDYLYICNNCYNNAELDVQSSEQNNKIYACQLCKTSQVKTVQVSYGNIQLQRFLRSIGIDLRFIPQEQTIEKIQKFRQLQKKTQ